MRTERSNTDLHDDIQSPGRRQMMVAGALLATLPVMAATAANRRAAVAQAPWTGFGGFEVNFLPEYKVLHDAGYNILAYDMRNHGRSGMGSGGVNGHGVLEYRDVIGSLHYQCAADLRHGFVQGQEAVLDRRDRSPLPWLQLFRASSKADAGLV
jgi:hypothetical protein